MRYRRLGNSDLLISEIALGTWLTYGVNVDRGQARACIDRAFSRGINLIDTANMYGKGATESLLGELLSAYQRDSFLLATKVYYRMSPEDKGLSRQQIHKQIDASLRRLRTDYVDLYQCHAYDKSTPLEETMEAMTEVVNSGKARYIGCSNWAPRQIRAAAELTEMAQFVSNQPQYSMLHRRPEKRLFPSCTNLGMTQIVWSPLAQGVLTGKYLPETRAPAKSRARNKATRKKIRRFTDDKVLSAVSELKPVADRLSLTMSQLALAWVLRQQCVTAAIIGASRPDQIDENIGAIGVTLDDSTLSEIDRILGDVVRR